MSSFGMLQACPRAWLSALRQATGCQRTWCVSQGAACLPQDLALYVTPSLGRHRACCQAGHRAWHSTSREAACCGRNCLADQAQAQSLACASQEAWATTWWPSGGCLAYRLASKQKACLVVAGSQFGWVLSSQSWLCPPARLQQCVPDCWTVLPAVAMCTSTPAWAQGTTHSLSPLVRAASCSEACLCCSSQACLCLGALPSESLLRTADSECYCACALSRQRKHSLLTDVSMQTMAPTSMLVSNSFVQTEVRCKSGCAACTI